MNTDPATYAIDARRLFCKHCGRTHVRHHYVSGLGFACEPPASDYDEFRTHSDASAIND